MNDQHPHDASDRSADEPVLPELPDERIEAMESTVFARIADDRAASLATAAAERRQRGRRSRIWVGAGAAAAVVAIAAVIAPSVGGLVSGSSGSLAEPAVIPGVSDAALDSPSDEGGMVTDSSAGAAESEAAAPDAFGAAGASGQDGAAATGEDQGAREIITTASTTVRVDDVEEAAEKVAASATAHGGYVESMNVGELGAGAYSDPDGQVIYEDSFPPYPRSGTWVTVRVPADELPALRTELSDLGEVVASDITRQDVTLQVLDVEARIESAQASVDRLTALMSEAGSVADLIAAESALAQRQAELESWQQQLTYLSDQVAMSSLTVNLVERVEQVEADPAGFGDGVAAGWNGLIATLNGIVIALGFLLPWLGVAAVVWLVVWLIVRGVRSRRAAKRDRGADATTSGDADA